MFEHLWVECGMLSGLTKKTLHFSNNEPILSSMLAAGIVQDTFAGETEEGERRRRSEDDWRLPLTTRAGNSSRFIAIEFLSQITNTRTHITNVRSYIYI